MNAKKIMGAVLVALLAAALFVGAGAADDKGTYFVYQESQPLYALNGTWTNGANSVVIEVNQTNGILLPVGDFVPGTYTKGKDTITVLNPSVSYKLSATYNDEPYLVANGGNVYKGSDIAVTITSLATGATVGNYTLTIGDAVAEKMAGDTYTKNDITKTGTYKIQALFTAGFVPGTPADLLLVADVFTFKVVSAADAKISAAVDTVYSGENVTFTVTGTPGETYIVNLTGFDPITTTQLITFSTVSAGNQTFQMPNTGKATFVATVNTSEEEAVAKLALGNEYVKDAEVKIAVSAPVVTATLGAPSYFIGDAIKVTGTSTAGAKFTFTIDGTNIVETPLTATETEWGKSWKATLSYGDLKLDVGTYTIKVKQGGDVVATLAVALKQPFISIVEAPEVIVQGTEAEFVINAESAAGVKAYFFGTNYFEAKNAVLEDKDVKNIFTVKLSKTETNSTNMATGQYFAVFQHPMYDKTFNIGADGDNIKLNNNGVYTAGNVIFNATDRQTANAAQALCDALDSQLIDDMYVKYSFFVAGEDESFIISEIPTQVVKGDKIVISGVDTANAGKTVAVEMISTAFAAVPKENVGSAAFIVVTTTVAKDGTWEVTLDTSDLNVDEYSLSVAIDSVTKKNVNVNVVEGSEPVTPTDEPTVVPTDEPVTPTEAPATPGFGALAALAGLGAVAVLLLRRE